MTTPRPAAASAPRTCFTGQSSVRMRTRFRAGTARLLDGSLIRWLLALLGPLVARGGICHVFPAGSRRTSNTTVAHLLYMGNARREGAFLPFQNL